MFIFLKKRFCPGQRSCPGQVASSKQIHILRKKSAPGSETARDKWFVKKKKREKNGFWKKFCPRKRSCPGQVASSKKINCLPKVLPQAAKLPGTSGFSRKKLIFWKKFCPRQRSCPGQAASSKKSKCSAKSSAPGSEAARDKWLLQKK